MSTFGVRSSRIRPPRLFRWFSVVSRAWELFSLAFSKSIRNHLDVSVEWIFGCVMIVFFVYARLSCDIFLVGAKCFFINRWLWKFWESTIAWCSCDCVSKFSVCERFELLDMQFRNFYFLYKYEVALIRWINIFPWIALTPE